MRFRVRAQFHGPDGQQVGVAEDDIEAEDACEVIQSYACPSPYTTGVYTSATVTVTLISDASE